MLECLGQSKLQQALPRALVQFDLGLQSTATPGRLNKLHGIGIKPYISDVAAAVGNFGAAVNMDTGLLARKFTQEQELPKTIIPPPLFVSEATIMTGKL